MPEFTDEYGLAAFPWEFQEGETDASHAAFIVYRNLGWRRTLRATAIAHYQIPEGDYDPNGGKIRNVERWSAQHRWVDRARKYDAWVQAAKDADDLDDIRAMRARHANIATALTSKAVEAIRLLGDRDLKRMGLDDLARTLQVAADVERKARGVAEKLEVISGARSDEEAVRSVSSEALARKLAAFRELREEGLIDDEGKAVVQQIPDEPPADDEETAK